MVRINLLFAELHGEETLALSVLQILTVFRSYYYQDSHSFSIHFLSRENFFPKRTPTYHILIFEQSIISVIVLAPSILEAYSLDR